MVGSSTAGRTATTTGLLFGLVMAAYILGLASLFFCPGLTAKGLPLDYLTSSAP